jgi:hypothetical protein
MPTGRKIPSGERRADVPKERRKTIPKPTLAKQMLKHAFAQGVKADTISNVV